MFVRRGEIAGILSDELVVTAWSAWRRYRRFGLPHGSGYLAERRRYLQAIEICEQEHDLFMSEEAKRE